MLNTKTKQSSKEILNSLKAVSDETRLRILNILSFGAFNVNEIVAVLEMGQSRISRHLKILTDAGLLESQREGTWVYYKLFDSTSQTRFQSELADLIISYKEELSTRESDQKKVSHILKEREDKSADYFNQIGKKWDMIQSEVMNPEIYRKWLIGSLPQKSDLILDLGCGPGGLISHIVPKANRVIGIDTSAKMIEEAANIYAKNKKVSFIQNSLENLPMKDKSTDAVIASMVLHHISNPPLVLQEAYRVLKNEGSLSIVELKKHDNEFMRDKYADLWLGFDPTLITEWLINSGFQIEEMKEISTNSNFVLLTIKANKKKGGLHVHSYSNKNSRL